MPPMRTRRMNKKEREYLENLIKRTEDPYLHQQIDFKSNLHQPYDMDCSECGGTMLPVEVARGKRGHYVCVKCGLEE